MGQLLEHLIDMPEDLGVFEPTIERAPLDHLLRPDVSEHELLKAKAQTVAAMFQHGLGATIDEQEETVAMQQFQRHIQQLPIEPHRVNTPAIVLKLTAMMSEYDFQVVRDAAQMRTYVTNRLLEESDPKMPASQRIKALDMLGKISGVDLFTERTEITIKTITTENLESKLHEKLRLLLPEEYSEIASENAHPQCN